MQVEGIPVTKRSGRIHTVSRVQNRSGAVHRERELTIALRTLHADRGSLNVVAAQLPGELGTVLGIVLTPHIDPRLASDAPLLAVLNGGSNAGSATGDTTGSTGPGGGSAHVDRDDDRDGSERSRGELDQASSGERREGGGGERDHLEEGSKGRGLVLVVV
jgi:hypothetical protein